MGRRGLPGAWCKTGSIGLRGGFHQQLIDIDDEVRALFTEVTVGVAWAASAFLAGDLREAPRFAAQHRITDTVLGRVEHELEVAFARQAPVASNLRFMLTVLRVVPQLERCTELAAHIAERAAIGPDLPGAVTLQFESMTALIVPMWEAASAAWANGDPTAASTLDDEDDELDVTVSELATDLATAELNPITAMEAALVGRFYERLGDHAVHVCDRIRWWATGD
jgi:phosphate transport system protein